MNSKARSRETGQRLVGRALLDDSTLHYVLLSAGTLCLLDHLPNLTYTMIVGRGVSKLVDDKTCNAGYATQRMPDARE